MSMFERLGEKVERFKQEAVSARDESADYRCQNCGNEIYSEQEQCPECGSTEIERVADADTENTERTEESGADEEAEDTD